MSADVFILLRASSFCSRLRAFHFKYRLTMSCLTQRGANWPDALRQPQSPPVDSVALDTECCAAYCISGQPAIRLRASN